MQHKCALSSAVSRMWSIMSDIYTCDECSPVTCQPHLLHPFYILQPRTHFVIISWFTSHPYFPVFAVPLDWRMENILWHFMAASESLAICSVWPAKCCCVWGTIPFLLPCTLPQELIFSLWSNRYMTWMTFCQMWCSQSVVSSVPLSSHMCTLFILMFVSVVTH